MPFSLINVVSALYCRQIFCSRHHGITMISSRSAPTETKEIPICDKYIVRGQETDEFPFPALLPEAKPVFRTMPGWNCDISGVRYFEDLPDAARDYVRYVEKAIDCRISFVSVGAERDEIIVMP